MAGSSLTCSFCEHAALVALNGGLHQPPHALKLAWASLSAAGSIALSHGLLHCGRNHIPGHVTLPGLDVLCNLGQHVGALAHLLSLHLHHQFRWAAVTESAHMQTIAH